MFSGLLIEKDEQGYRCTRQQLDDAILPEGNVEVAISYSTLNYKDALAISGSSPIARTFPLIPGIDFVGTVSRSDDSLFTPGQEVLLNGWGVGESHSGGLAQKARVKGDWLIAKPEAMSARDTMAVGTAGYTAMLCLMALEQHGVKPDNGPVLVTGANGGVGGFAIYLLSQLGFDVMASTGRLEEAEYLKSLGAGTIIHRDELSSPGKPLSKVRWQAAIDAVGSHTLANVCAATAEEGIVAACGLAQGMDFPASVAPFILRGVTLRGINCVTRPRSLREEAWKRLASMLDSKVLTSMTQVITLDQAIETSKAMLAGKVRGRVVVDVNA
ncbi:MDR family oxidoreductase [Pokkaliibacter sp. CJK22405]|uniref:acrylyl-CoA reductase (NADPH) n=1 Tax=Pokkaliibacter sp. CJK22405 TaxID=3384615 RepID=UPI003984B9B8